MALKYYISSDVTALVDKLSDVVKNNRNVMVPEKVIVQTEGMENWINVQIASKNGVFGNFKYSKPNSFIYELSYVLGLHQNSQYSTERLKWMIYYAMGDAQFNELFPKTASYYQDNAVKRMQLAIRLADLYDQYLVYRPHMITTWNENHKLYDNKEEQEKTSVDWSDIEAWQIWIWNYIKEKLAGIQDRAQLREKLQKSLENTENHQKIKDYFPQVSLFGLSILTQYHLDLFLMLSKILDVNFFFLNPCPDDFWYYDKSNKDVVKWKRWGEHVDAEDNHAQKGNELLTNWGKLARDLYGNIYKNDEFLDVMEVLEPINIPEAKTLLSTIQDDIRNNRVDQLHSLVPEKTRNEITEDLLHDGSIKISNNYTISREVEVLYDYLVNLIESDKTINPEDIVVMVPEVDKYAPFVKAIFENAPYKLPFSISDKGISQEESITSSLSQIFEIDRDKCTSEDILGLLDITMIKNQFGISNIKDLRQVVKDVNIRQGIEGDGELETDLVSWKRGIQKLIFGISISESGMFTVKDEQILPFTNTEGELSREVLRFIGFVEAIIETLNKMNKARKLSEWMVFINETVYNLFEIKDEQEIELQYLRTQLETLVDIEETFGDEYIPFDVFKNSLINYLVANKKNSGYYGGRITFCGMIPMRSIPFKTVCMLGLNCNDFPRVEEPLRFDLLQYTKQRGDRNIKDNDKYLFLEAFMAAKEQFYLSYQGKNLKNNEDVPPSLLVDNLLNYISSGLVSKDSVLVKNQLVTNYPLHNFSKKYNVVGGSLVTYLKTEAESNKLYHEESIELHDSDSNTIQIDELIKFYDDPIKYYYQKTLGVYYTEDDLTVEESEAFELDGLQNYFIKEAILNHSTNDSLTQNLKRNGLLPLGNYGDVLVETQQNNLQALIDQLSYYTKEQSSEIEVDFELAGNRIEGVIDNVYNGKKITYSLSKGYKDKQFVFRLYINHLILQASGQLQSDSVFINLEGKETILNTDFISRKQAQETLEQLISIYKQGRQKLIPILVNLYPSPTNKTGLERSLGLDFNPYVSNAFNNGAFLEYQDYKNNETASKVLLSTIMEPIKQFLK